MDATPEMIRTPREPVKPDAVSPALFAHFVLRTSNFEAMRKWYKTVLNARMAGNVLVAEARAAREMVD
jgi:hypothetical protein